MITDAEKVELLVAALEFSLHGGASGLVRRTALAKCLSDIGVCRGTSEWVSTHTVARQVKKLVNS